MSKLPIFIKCIESHSYPLGRTVYVNVDSISAITEDLFEPDHKEGCVIRVAGVKEYYFFMDKAEYLIDSVIDSRVNRVQCIITPRNTQQS